MEEDDLPEEAKFDALGEDFLSNQQIPFKVSSNYGRGSPHFYVILSVGERDEHNWWFDPDQAEDLGIRLQQEAVQSRRGNEQQGH